MLYGLATVANGIPMVAGNIERGVARKQLRPAGEDVMREDEAKGNVMRNGNGL